MHNPVSVFVLLGIVIAGVALGIRIVRKFVISEDGSVNVGVSQYVKWAMRVIASMFIFQSTLDTPLALGTLVSSFGICFLITSFKLNNSEDYMFSGNGSMWGSRGQKMKRQNRAEFLSRSRKFVGSVERQWNISRKSSSPWSDSRVKGVISPPNGRSRKTQEDHYSTFHKTLNRKKITKREWENFTKESTKQALWGLASSPDFTDWVIKNAERIQPLPDKSEGMLESRERFSLFRW